MKFTFSRTIITAILLFVFNGFQALEQSVPTETFMLVNAVLTALVAYFRANPRIK